MTTLILKSGLAKKALSSAESMLGDHRIKSGRYWYKGHQNCDLIVLKRKQEMRIQTSGGVRFSLVVEPLPDGDARGRVTLLGWLKESPNALRIVMSILESHSKKISRKRRERLLLEEKARLEGQDEPEFREPLGSHFSIKVDDSKLDAADRISAEESQRNFESALRSHWYHHNFVTFCQRLGVKCYYREVHEREDRVSPFPGPVESTGSLLSAGGFLH